MISINGQDVSRLQVTLPSWGIWWADVELPGAAELRGPVTLVLDGHTMRGAVVSGGISGGIAKYRVAAGAGKWGAIVAAQAYANDAGIKAVTLAQDAASACGETIDPSGLVGRVVGASYVRERAPASYVLEALAPRGWYVGADGVTRIGQRMPVTLAGEHHILSRDPAMGSVTFATGELSRCVPGLIIEGQTSEDVVLETRDGGIVVTSYASARRVSALGRIAAHLENASRFRGVFEYRVVLQTGQLFDLQPTMASLGLPDISRVPVRYGVPGVRADVTPGALALVAFVNADRARPVVVGFDDTAILSLAIGDDEAANPLAAQGRVVRYGDIVSIPVVGGAAAQGAVALAPAATVMSRVHA